MPAGQGAEWRRWSFAELDAQANRVAHWCLAGVARRGDCIGLLMTNKAAYLAHVLGVCKAACIVSLLNTENIEAGPMVGALTVANARVLIFDCAFQTCVDASAPALMAAGIRLACHGPGPSSIDAEGARQPHERPASSVRAGVRFTDPFGFIYTSGTTGFPKACVISHQRQAYFPQKAMHIVDERDVIYGNGLPLYHSAGFGVGAGLMMLCGACLVVRPRFSASAALPDIHRFGCTVLQYIGEIARYMCRAPLAENDGTSSLRLAVGNGLRLDHWQEFQTRFRVQMVLEFYGATEANGSTSNLIELDDLISGGPGAEGVGAIGNIFGHRGCGGSNFKDMRLATYDSDLEDVVRLDNGFVKEGTDVGELLFKIQPDLVPGSNFNGYHGDRDATESKVLRGCFERGDAYMRTGDVVRIDRSSGWVYFVDRVGDTFRWKGENVAADEVAAQLATCELVDEVIVYAGPPGSG